MRCPFLSLGAALILVLTVLHGVHGQQDHGWSVTRHTTHDGLPQNSIRSLVLDAQGFLWITTEGGLTMFDGRTFRHLRIKGEDISGAYRMRNLTLTLNGDLITDDARGHAYMVSPPPNRHLRTISKDSPPMNLRGMAPSEAAYLRTTRPDGLIRRSDHNLPPPHVDLIILGQGRWGVSTSGQLVLFKDTTEDRRIELPPRTMAATCSKGHLVALTEAGQVFRVDVGTGRTSPMHIGGDLDGVKHPPVQDLDVFRDIRKGTMYWTLEGSLFRMVPNAKGDTLLAEHIAVELPTGTRVSAVMEDPEEGLLALGTNTKGLFIYRKRYMATSDCNDAFMSNSLYTQCEIAEGTLLTAGNDRIGRTYGPDGCAPAPHPLRMIKFRGLLLDRKGRIWFSSDTTAERYDPGTGKVETIIPDPGPGAVFLEEGDSVWVGTSRSLGVVGAQGYRKVFDLPPPPSQEPIYRILRLPDGRMALATCNGLFLSEDPSCTSFTPVPGFKDMCVRALEVLEGDLYVGTYGAGGYIMSGDRVVPLPMDGTGALSHVHTFFLDALGSVWMSTDRGLVRSGLADLQALLANEKHRPYYAFYGEQAGLTSTELNGGASPPHVLLSDGRVSFPSMEGLVQFVPEEVPFPYPRKGIRFLNIHVDGLEHDPFRDGSKLPPGVEELLIDVSLPYWGEPVNAQLEYRIPGIQDQWSPLSVELPRIRIIRPRWGAYTIIVRLVGGGDKDGPAPAVLRFSVSPPWYVRPTAVIGYLVLLGLLLVMVSEFRARRLRTANLRLERSVRERTKALDSANSFLRRELRVRDRILSIISHDILTPIRFISRVSHGTIRMLADPMAREHVEDTLKDLALSADKLHVNTDNLVRWAKQQQRGFVPEPTNVALHPFAEEHLEMVNEMAAIKGVPLENAVDVEEMVHTDRQVLGIILNNLLTNAITHNTTPFMVRVSSISTPDEVRIVVEDSGQGIPHERLERLRKAIRSGGELPAMGDEDPGGIGLGYGIIGELASLIKVGITVDSSPRGTTVTIVLPKRVELPPL